MATTQPVQTKAGSAPAAGQTITVLYAPDSTGHTIVLPADPTDGDEHWTIEETGTSPLPVVVDGNGHKIHFGGTHSPTYTLSEPGLQTRWYYADKYGNSLGQWIPTFHGSASGTGKSSVLLRALKDATSPVVYHNGEVYLEDESGRSGTFRECRPFTFLDYSGTGDFHDFGDLAASDFGDGPFAFTSWVRGGTVDRIVISKDGSIGTNDGLMIRVNSGSYSYWNGVTHTAIGSVSSTKWQHIAAVRESQGTDKVKLYLDGVLAATATDTRTLSNALNLRLSGDTVGTNVFDGDVYDARLFNVSKTADEILAIKQLNNDVSGALWRIIGQTNDGAVEFDSSDNENNPDVTGTPWGTDKTGAPPNVQDEQGFSICRTFDAANDFLTLGRRATVSSIDGITVMAAFRISAVGATRNLLNEWKSQAGQRMWTMSIQSPGALILFVSQDGGVTNFRSATSDLNYDDGKWHTVIARAIDTGSSVSIEMWVDGESVAVTLSGSGTGFFTVASGTYFGIGALDTDSGGSAFFDGDIHHVAMWQEALSDENIIKAFSLDFPVDPLVWVPLDDFATDYARNLGTDGQALLYAGTPKQVYLPLRSSDPAKAISGLTLDYAGQAPHAIQLDNMSALSLNGSSQYVTATGVKFAPTTDYLVRVRCKIPANSAVEEIWDGRQSGAVGMRLIINASGNVLVVIDGATVATTSNTYDDDNWYTYTISDDGSEFKLEISDQRVVVERITAASGLPSAATTVDVRIGATASAAGNYSNADYCEVYVEEDGAITFHWVFVEQSGATVYDITSNDNDGAATGSPTWVTTNDVFSYLTQNGARKSGAVVIPGTGGGVAADGNAITRGPLQLIAQEQAVLFPESDAAWLAQLQSSTLNTSPYQVADGPAAQLSVNTSTSGDDTFEIEVTESSSGSVGDFAFKSSVIVTVADTDGDYICDGTDDDVQIQSAIASLPAGGGVVLLKKGTYDIGAVLDVPSNVWLRGEGYATHLRKKNSSGTSNVINVVSESNVRISDLRVDGNKANNTSDYFNVNVFESSEVWIHNVATHDANRSSTEGEGIRIAGSDHVTCYACRAYDNGGVGIKWTTSSSGTNRSQYATCEMCEAWDNGSDGLLMFEVDGSKMVSNVSHENGDDGITLHGEETTDTGPKYSICNNNISYLNTEDGIVACTSGDSCTCNDNTVYQNGEQGINFFFHAKHSTVTGNVCKFNGFDGIFMQGENTAPPLKPTRYSIVADNVCFDNGYAGAIYSGIRVAFAAQNLSITGNICTCTDSDNPNGTPPNQRYGINIQDEYCRNVRVTNNVLDGNRLGPINDDGTNTYTFGNGEDTGPGHEDGVFAVFLPGDADLKLHGTNPPAQTTRATTNYSRDVLEFDDTTNELCAWGPRVMPYSHRRQGVYVDIYVTSKGDDLEPEKMVFEGAFERSRLNESDLDIDGFDTAKSVTIMSQDTNDTLVVGTIEFDNDEMDDIRPGEVYRFQLECDAVNAAHTVTGDSQVVAVYMRQRGSALESQNLLLLTAESVVWQADTNYETNSGVEQWTPVGYKLLRFERATATAAGTREVNGLTALDFDGTERLDGFPTSDTPLFPLGVKNTGTTHTELWISFQFDGATGEEYLITGNDGGTTDGIGRNSSDQLVIRMSDTDTAFTTIDLGDTDPHVLRIENTGTLGQYRCTLDDGTPETQTLGSSGEVAIEGLGVQQDGTNFFDGAIMHVYLNEGLTTAQDAEAWNYLMNAIGAS